MADGYNVCTFIGNLVADAELRAAGGDMVLNFRLACSETYKDREGNKRENTTFVPCAMWGKRADALAQYMVKGKQVFVSGSLQIRSYEKDGQKRYATDIKVHDVRLLGGGGGEAGSGGGRQSARRDDDGYAPQGGGSGGGYSRGGGNGGGAARTPQDPAEAADAGGFGSDSDIPF